MTWSDWIAALALLASVVVGLFQMRQWRRSEATDRRMLEIEEWRHEQERGAAEEAAEAAGRAHFDLELHSLDERMFMLTVRNLGPGVAEAVEVRADASVGPFRTLVSFPSVRVDSPGTHHFTNHEWQVIGGTRLSCKVTWTDEDGVHEDIDFVATVR